MCVYKRVCGERCRATEEVSAGEAEGERRGQGGSHGSHVGAHCLVKNREPLSFANGAGLSIYCLVYNFRLINYDYFRGIVIRYYKSIVRRKQT